MDDDEPYVTIRSSSLLGDLIGQKVVDITQQDEDEYTDRGAFIEFFFENGTSIRFPVHDCGFNIYNPKD